MPATKSIDLVDYDSGQGAGKKWFCSEHFPAEAAPQPPPPSLVGFGSEEGGLAAMDVHAFLNIRDWLQAACEAKGAKMDGGGIGCGQADIDIELEGCRYNISIRPLPRR